MGISPKYDPYKLFIFSWLQVLNGLKLYNRSCKIVKDSKSELVDGGIALGGGGGMTTLHIENFHLPVLFPFSFQTAIPV